MHKANEKGWSVCWWANSPLAGSRPVVVTVRLPRSEPEKLGGQGSAQVLSGVFLRMWHQGNVQQSSKTSPLHRWHLLGSSIQKQLCSQTVSRNTGRFQKLLEASVELILMETSSSVMVSTDILSWPQDLMRQSETSRIRQARQYIIYDGPMFLS